MTITAKITCTCDHREQLHKPTGAKTYQEARLIEQERRKDAFGKSRVYISIPDENIIENFGNRTSRPFKVWRPYVEACLREAGIEFKKLRWDRYAGCRMCPCSPGFVIEDGSIGLSIWVELTGAPVVTDPEEAAHRKAALLSDPTIVAALEASVIDRSWINLVEGE